MVKRISFIMCLWAAFSLVLVVGAGAATISLSDTWNLVSSRTPITVSTTFSSGDNFESIWKWENSVWAVYLPGEGDGGAAYADTKGFNTLSTISPGQGFWVNSKGTQSVIVDGTAQTSNTLSLIEGWNLLGPTISSSITVSTVFSDSTKFASVWKWESNTWAVYLPGESTAGEYATSKSFNVLSTISDGEGFWINALSAETADFSSGVETPPLVGKVSEVTGDNDKNSYKAVPNAAVSINDTSVGKTDSQGKFATMDYSGSSVKVDVQLSGYVSFSETVTIPDSNQIYIFIQKQDTNKEELEATQSVSLEKFFKPTPKVMTSSDNTTSITITNMQLTSDITVSVTPYNSLNTIPDTEAIAGLGLGKVDIVGGGDVSVVDSDGNATTGEAAGFSAQVASKTTKVFGKWTLDKIESKIGSNDTDKLYLLSKTSSGWTKVGEAKVEQGDNSSAKYMLPNSGVVMTTLDSFIFVLTTSEQGVQENQISGKVVKKGTSEGVPGVFVGMDGIFTEAVTDESGNFTLDFHIMDVTTLNIQYLFLYAWKDGYFAGSKDIPVDTQADDLTNITVELEPFGQAFTISGHVYSEATNEPIADAIVVLKTPSVLDEVFIEENKVHVGKNDHVHYKWVIMQEPDTLFGEPTVLKTIPPTKGKNFLSTNDFQELLANVTGETVFLITLEVTKKMGENQFREEATGLAFVYESGGQQVVEFDLMPDFTNFSVMEAWTDSQGAYEFYDVSKDMIPFVKAGAKASGYKRSAFTILPKAQNGVITKDFTLQVQTKAQPWVDSFETGAPGWIVKVESGGTLITNSNTTWNLLENPDQVVMPPNLLNNVMFADMGWVDVVGNIGTITINSDLSNDFEKVGNASVEFLESGVTKTIQTELYDRDGPDGLPDGKYESIWFANPDDYFTYDLWYDFEKYPLPEGTAEFWSLNLVEGSEIMVSYQGVQKGEGEGLTLLPTLPDTGTHVYWLGNLNSADYRGTYYDPGLNTGDNRVNAVLESPTIDLTNFSFAKLLFKAWFEINGANFSSLTLEVALMDENLDAFQTVTLEAEYGDVDVKKGESAPLFQFNPFVEMDLGAFGSPEAGTTTFQKTALPKEGLFQEVVNDDDGDGMPDDWESSWEYCTGVADLKPWGDLDWDTFTNVDEYLWGGNPCDDTSPDADLDFLPDPWEAQWTACEPDGDLDPWEDSDGDGYTNEDEFWLGSDPCDPNSPSGVEEPTYPTEPAIGLTWAGEFAPPVWEPFEFNLSPYAGHKIIIRFKFGFKNKNTNLFRGWAVDDIKILDEESDRSFEIMTPEFGHFGDFFFEEIEQGTSWAGSYLMSFSDGFQQNFIQDPTGDPTVYTMEDQTITVTQEGLWATTTITFAGVECTLEGNFLDEAYDYLNFWFYDTDQSGLNVAGWGEVFLDPDTGALSGYIEGDDSNGITYWGTISFTAQQ